MIRRLFISFVWLPALFAEMAPAQAIARARILQGARDPSFASQALMLNLFSNRDVRLARAGRLIVIKKLLVWKPISRRAKRPGERPRQFFLASMVMLTFVAPALQLAAHFSVPLIFAPVLAIASTLWMIYHAARELVGRQKADAPLAGAPSTVHSLIVSGELFDAPEAQEIDAPGATVAATMTMAAHLLQMTRPRAAAALRRRDIGIRVDGQEISFDDAEKMALGARRIISISKSEHAGRRARMTVVRTRVFPVPIRLKALHQRVLQRTMRASA